MNNMKRLSLALIALGLSAPAFADSTVLVPSQHGGFKAGIDALYLRPTNGDLHYATNISSPGNVIAGGFQRNAYVDPSYDWGFYAQIGYLFPCTGNDITVGYTYLRSDDTDSTIAPSVASPAVSTIAILPLSAIFSPATTYAAASGKARFDLNVVDLEGGQRFTTGAYDMRMFAGLRYANINHELQAFGSNPSNIQEVGSDSGSQEFKSQVRGLGPRIGVDTRYCFGSGFGFDADLSTSLLVGQVDGRYSATRTTTGGTPTTTTTQSFTSKDGSDQRLIPVLEAKLGLNYTYIMDCRCKSALTFEVGYQATNYFNALDRSRVISAVDGTDIVHQNANTDIAFDGIYFGVKYYA